MAFHLLTGQTLTPPKSKPVFFAATDGETGTSSNEQNGGPRLAIATGGTGGHFFPALSIAREYRRRVGPAILIIGGQQAQAHLELARQHGFSTAHLDAVRMPPSFWGVPLFSLRLAWEVFRGRRLLRSLHIDRVLGMGSFASVPLCLAAAFTGKPLFLHEGNAVLGRANRFLQRRARKLLLSLPLSNQQTPRAPTLLTGFPLRSELLTVSRNISSGNAAGEMRQKFGLDPNLPTLLVFGGSQGADFFNRLLPALCRSASPSTPLPPFQLLQFTGSETAAEHLRRAFDQAGLPAYVAAWSNHMEEAYQAADLVLCRGGAATIAELAWFGKPAIIVPLPNAAEDHQSANAELLARADAARFWRQDETTPARLKEAVAEFVAAPERWQEQGRNFRSWSRPEAARQIVDAIAGES